MFVGDDEPAGAPVLEPAAHVPELPAVRPPVTEPRDIRSRLQGFFSLPPAEPAEGSTAAQPAGDADEPGGSSRNAIGCLTMMVVMFVGGFVEDMLPLSDRQKIFGMVGLVAALLLVAVWTSLHDSDLAYKDRGSDGRMARFRNRLRQLFDIPVI